MRINSPQVTGISPNKGPPGTKFTIRGENLGLNKDDVISLMVCGVECVMSMEWKTSNKLVAKTGAVIERGPIIVTTRSGGVGTCTVVFIGEYVSIGPLQESVIWIDEAYLFDSPLNDQLINQQYDDPLGLSQENTNAMTSQNINLEKLFVGGCGDISKDNFVSSWFLLEYHQHTSLVSTKPPYGLFQDLKLGLGHLDESSIQLEEGPQAFVKTNLSNFMDCYNTLTDVDNKILGDRKLFSGLNREDQREQAYNTCITNKLLTKLQEANLSADELFKDVLCKKDRAEQTRTALGVIKRFKWLFNLPHLISNNIEKGEYDIIISDINRANTLEEIIQVDVFQRVYSEIRRQREKFKHHLNEKLLELPQSLDNQKRLVRYLMQLEDDSDPAWTCISNMHLWILSTLIACKDRHIEHEKFVNSSEFKNDAKLRTNLLSTSDKATKPERVVFIENITSILQVTLADLYKLGLAYLSGKLYKESKISQKISNQREKEFKTMILEVVDMFTRLDRAALLPRSLDSLSTEVRLRYGHWSPASWTPQLSVEWLSTCVKCHRTCLSSFANMELLPVEAINQLDLLVFDLRSHCFFALLQQAILNIKELHTREIWKVDTNDDIGAITLLPVIYERVVSETVQFAAEIVKPSQGEKNLFSGTNLHQQIARLATELLQSFACTLAYLGQKDFVIKLNASNVNQMSRQFVAEKLLNWDKRLPIVIDNTRYICSEILPRLVDLLRKHNYPHLDLIIKDSMLTYRSLDRKLFTSYTELKSSQIIGRLEQEMYTSAHDWAKCRKPRDIQNYLKEAILGIITVHADVYTISPNLVNETLLCVIEAVVEEMTRLLHCVQDYNRYGVLQAMIDLSVIQEGLGKFLNRRTITLFRDCFKSLPQLQWPEDEKLVHTLLTRGSNHGNPPYSNALHRFIDVTVTKCSKRLKFQFQCFQVL